MTSRRRPLRWQLEAPLFAWLCVLASACGGSGSSSPHRADGGNTADGGNDAGKVVKGDGTPCGDYAAASCNAASLCGSQVIRLAGGLTGCVASTKTLCAQALSYPSTGVNATTLAKCTAAIDTTSPCGTTPACDFTGSLPDGATCGSDWQCSSGYCDGAGPTSSITDGGLDWTFSCGQCAPTLTIGAQCSTNSAACSPSSQCVSMSASASTTCEPFGGVGDPCGDQSCSGWLVCDATGHCARAPGAGSQCAGGACDLARDIFCNDKTGLCEHAKTAAVGETCNLPPTQIKPRIVNCVAGSTCLPPVGTSQHCVANAKIGDACDNSNLNGPICGGAVCSGGVCTAMDPASCH